MWLFSLNAPHCLKQLRNAKFENKQASRARSWDAAVRRARAPDSISAQAALATIALISRFLLLGIKQEKYATCHGFFFFWIKTTFFNAPVSRDRSTFDTSIRTPLCG